MFKDIGKKIKGLAVVIFVLGTIASIVSAIILMTSYRPLVLIGILVLFTGPLVAWIGTWMTYGFGELIDKTAQIERNTRVSNNFGGVENMISAGTTKDPKISDKIERIIKLEKLYNQGLITEEYEEQRAKIVEKI